MRGPMPRFLADIHPTRAKFAGSFKGTGERIDVDAKAERAQATALLRALGDGRRQEALVDPERRWERTDRASDPSLRSNARQRRLGIEERNQPLRALP
jgi:hypothetical protein